MSKRVKFDFEIDRNDVDLPPYLYPIVPWYKSE